jgi:hypothetical protein
MKTEPPIAQVTVGMRVIDAGGEEIGRVDSVRHGDPNAVTAQAPTGDAVGTLANLISSVAAEEPDVPADAEARLRRAGYVKVNGHRGVHAAVYVEADQIAKVTDDVVHLGVVRTDLTPEQ